jgi:hypothetical protein
LTYHASVATYHFVTQNQFPTPDDPKNTATSEPADRASGDGKKERVLHTRVPAVLEQELKRFADNLRVPVSNLVRTILEDALEVADVATDRVEERLRRAAEQLDAERTKLKQRVQRGNPLARVFAFQDVTLAQSAACAQCGVRLEAGGRAFLGLVDAVSTSRATPRLFACAACLPNSQSQMPENPAAKENGT